MPILGGQRSVTLLALFEGKCISTNMQLCYQVQDISKVIFFTTNLENFVWWTYQYILVYSLYWNLTITYQAVLQNYVEYNFKAKSNLDSFALVHQFIIRSIVGHAVIDQTLINMYTIYWCDVMCVRCLCANLIVQQQRIQGNFFEHKGYNFVWV